MTTDNKKFWLALIASLVVSYAGMQAPNRMPLDYHAMISRSIPLAAAWAVLLGSGLWHYKAHGLWLLVGAPMALYWPVWLLFNRFPPCYYVGNCV